MSYTDLNRPLDYLYLEVQMSPYCTCSSRTAYTHLAPSHHDMHGPGDGAPHWKDFGHMEQASPGLLGKLA